MAVTESHRPRIAPQDVPKEGTATPSRAIEAFWWTTVDLRALARSRLFWSVLLLKAGLGAVLASDFPTRLFIPFLNYFVESGFQNPWSHFAALGRLESFPYPPAMLYCLAFPRWLFQLALPAGTETVTWMHLFALRLPMLAADFSILWILLAWFPTRQRRVLWLYWSSPILFYVSYWHGQLDIIPTAIFLTSLYLMYKKRFTWGMIVGAVALATKSHLMSAIPFVLVYTFYERRGRGLFKALSLGALTYVALIAPYLGDPAFRKMVYGTSEQLRLFAAHWAIGSSGSSLLIAPAAIVLLWFRFAAYPKWNWDLFMLYLGMLFGIFILLIPPAPGYFLWSLPFVIYFCCRTSSRYVGIYVAYSAAYLLFQCLRPESDFLTSFQLVAPRLAALPNPYQALSQISPTLASQANDLAFTLMEATVAGLTLGMHFFGVRSNALYSQRTSPIVIGVAGDSGSGKDTFVRLTTSLIGPQRVTVTSGDDYHRWPRGHEKWKVYTHLDVRANNVYQEQEHAISLYRGRGVARSNYDHATGNFTKDQLVDPNHCLIFSGLHSLSLHSLRNLYDLKVFLDPEEGLRTWWKIQRDCAERGYSPKEVRAKLEQRRKDRERFILPQRAHADLILRYSAQVPLNDDGTGEEPELRLECQALNSFNWIELVNGVSHVSTLKIGHEPYADPMWQTLTLSGKITAAQLRSIAVDTVENLDEILTGPARFEDDLPGLSQLIFLNCLSHQLRWNMKSLT